ncbi:MAG TPA: DUF4296 domain-containing protein [Bacteroidia bacterium]|nr:DUF4296 domain-containing protein [Bacteroidia bacterium]HNS12748.1 DUF4296 domain-containing protein [Bacteroidia bacterium]
MKQIFIVLFTLLCLNSCKDNSVIIPDNILSKEELVPVLVDIQIAQASQIIFEYSDTIKYSLKQYQMEILKKKNIPEEKFQQSMKFYSTHPELLQDIYNEVVNELSKKEGELENR